MERNERAVTKLELGKSGGHFTLDVSLFRIPVWRSLHCEVTMASKAKAGFNVWNGLHKLVVGGLIIATLGYGGQVR